MVQHIHLWVSQFFIRVPPTLGRFLSNDGIFSHHLFFLENCLHLELAEYFSDFLKISQTWLQKLYKSVIVEIIRRGFLRPLRIILLQLHFYTIFVTKFEIFPNPLIFLITDHSVVLKM